MSTENFQPTPQEIYYAADQYLPYLSEPLQSQIEALLEETQVGIKLDNAILSLISDDPEARQWMRQALFGEQFERMRSGYDPLAGSGFVVQANSQWRCPKCGFLWRVMRIGRPVPPCPKDQSVLAQIQA